MQYAVQGVTEGLGASTRGLDQSAIHDFNEQTEQERSLFLGFMLLLTSFAFVEMLETLRTLQPRENRRSMVKPKLRCS